MGASQSLHQANTAHPPLPTDESAARHCVKATDQDATAIGWALEESMCVSGHPCVRYGTCTVVCERLHCTHIVAQAYTLKQHACMHSFTCSDMPSGFPARVKGMKSYVCKSEVETLCGLVVSCSAKRMSVVECQQGSS